MAKRDNPDLQRIEQFRKELEKAAKKVQAVVSGAPRRLPPPDRLVATATMVSMLVARGHQLSSARSGKADKSTSRELSEARTWLAETLSEIKKVPPALRKLASLAQKRIEKSPVLILKGVRLAIRSADCPPWVLVIARDTEALVFKLREAKDMEERRKLGENISKLPDKFVKSFKDIKPEFIGGLALVILLAGFAVVVARRTKQA